MKKEKYIRLEMLKDKILRKMDKALIFSLLGLLLIPFYIWGLRSTSSEQPTEEFDLMLDRSMFILPDEIARRNEDEQGNIKAGSRYAGRVADGIVFPFPVVPIKDEYGRNVCAKKKDNPGKNNQGKPVHIDLECCLDPDEIPNIHCYYSPEKYGKILRKYQDNKAKMLLKFREGKNL